MVTEKPGVLAPMGGPMLQAKAWESLRAPAWEPDQGFHLRGQPSRPAGLWARLFSCLL